MTKDAAKSATIEALSTLLADLPENELCLVLAHYEEAIRTGKFLAVPVDGETFSIKHLDAQGQSTERTVPDEFVEVSEGWTGWLERMRRESRYTIMSNTGTIATTRERLGTTDDFAVLARLRKEQLAQRETAAARPKAKAPGKATPPSKSKAKGKKAEGAAPVKVEASSKKDAPAPATTPAAAPSQPEVVAD